MSIDTTEAWASNEGGTEDFVRHRVIVEGEKRSHGGDLGLKGEIEGPSRKWF